MEQESSKKSYTFYLQVEPKFGQSINDTLQTLKDLLKDLEDYELIYLVHTE